MQRITALNLFLHDIYHEQSILRDGVIPKQIVWEAAHFRPEFMHFDVPRNIYIHICGTDLIRDGEGNYLVLEDNARCPSGVSYVLENRQAMKRIFPTLFSRISGAAGGKLRAGIAQRPALRRAARSQASDGRPAHARAFITRLTSSIRFSRARWESRSSRAAIWSCRRATFSCARRKGLKPVDVIYRRINDDFLDPRFSAKTPGSACRDWSTLIAAVM